MRKRVIKIYDIVPPGELELWRKELQREKYFSEFSIKNSIRKIISLLLIIALNWTGLSAGIGTFASFNNNEVSDINSIQLATLDFSLNSPGDFSPEVTPTQTSNRTITLINNGILGFQYTVTTTNTTGTLCDYLTLPANLDGNNVYNGPLTNFNYNAGEFSTSTDDWQFTAALTSDDLSLQNQTCVFDFIFDGTQIGGAGFYDREVISNTITSGVWLKIVVNKVYYDVCDKKDESCGDYKGKEGKNEWLELYNPTDQDINVKDWQICNREECKTIHSNVSIPAFGFALLSHDNSTWSLYWNVPDYVEKINLGTAPNDGWLDNEADMLLLKNPDGLVIDQMNWGTPTTTWPNYNSELWDPGAIDVAEGNILGRISAGFDTNQPSDWKEFWVPQVTIIYPKAGIGWSCNRTYTLEWKAMTSDGKDGNLTIDIWYITDKNNNWEIDDGDEFYLIADDIENSGSYQWKIDFFQGYCYFGYVWIKVIATNPENFMVNGAGLSSRIFEPPDPEFFDFREYCTNLEEYCSGLEKEICDNLKEYCVAAERYFLPALDYSGVPDQTQDEIEDLQEISQVSNLEETQGPEEMATTSEEMATTTEATTSDDIVSQEQVIGQETNDSVQTPLQEGEESEEMLQLNNREEQQKDVSTEEIPAIEEEPVILPEDDSSNPEKSQDDDL